MIAEEELSLDELKEKIASLQVQLLEKQKAMLKEISNQIKECAATRGIEVEHVLLEIAKHYGYTMTKIVAVAEKKTVRKGKPSIKQPLKDKLNAAGIKYSAQLSVAQLQEVVVKHNL